MRKISWIFAFVVFIGLFLYRNVELIEKDYNFIDFNPSYIYLITSFLSLIMLWYDGTIQRALDKARYQDLAEIKKIERRAELIEEYDKIQDRFLKKTIAKGEANKLINSIKQRAGAYKIDAGLFTLIS